MADHQDVARRWHDLQFAGEAWPDEVPLADDYLFVGPPMSFQGRDAYVRFSEASRAWVHGGGQVEVLAQYGSGDWYTSVITMHSATSDTRVVATLTSHLAGGEVVAEYFAYDPRVAYNQVSGLQDRLDQMLGDKPGAAYGLP